MSQFHSPFPTIEGNLFTVPPGELRILDLAGTTISDAAFEHLGGTLLRRIEELNLKGTAITDDGLSYLSTIIGRNNRLRKIDLRGTRATQKGAGVLQARCPGCKIER